MDRTHALQILSSCPVSSFGTAKQAVDSLIGLELLEKNDMEMLQVYDSIARIIADVFVKSPRGEVKVAGETVTFGIVQEIFRELDGGHVQRVVDSLRKYLREITYAKAFIRSALYNAVLEGAAQDVNELVTDGMIGEQ